MIKDLLSIGQLSREDIERILDTALAEAIRLVGHREQLFAPAIECPLEYSVRVVDEQGNADRRPVERLRAEIECGRVLVDDDERRAVDLHLDDDPLLPGFVACELRRPEGEFVEVGGRFCVADRE